MSVYVYENIFSPFVKHVNNIYYILENGAKPQKPLQTLFCQLIVESFRIFSLVIQTTAKRLI